MDNLVVFINREKLPSRADWEAVAADRKIPLAFPENFDPHAHPICERAQVNHPDGEVAAKISDATCRYQLDVYERSHDDFEFHSDPGTFQDCDLSLAYRWHEVNAVNSVGAHFSAATLALAADGVILWQRTEGGSCRGAQAFKVLVAKAWRRIRGPGYRFSKQNPFGPPLEPIVKKDSDGRFECPRCGLPFGLDSRQVYDGEKHTVCGQLLVPPTSSG